MPDVDPRTCDKSHYYEPTLKSKMDKALLRPCVAPKPLNWTQPVLIQIILSRNRTKDLLEHAKCTVEIPIEQDEQAAIDWLESVSEVADI